MNDEIEFNPLKGVDLRVRRGPMVGKTVERSMEGALGGPESIRKTFVTNADGSVTMLHTRGTGALPEVVTTEKQVVEALKTIWSYDTTAIKLVDGAYVADYVIHPTLQHVPTYTYGKGLKTRRNGLIKSDASYVVPVVESTYDAYNDPIVKSPYYWHDGAGNYVTWSRLEYDGSTLNQCYVGAVQHNGVEFTGAPYHAVDASGGAIIAACRHVDADGKVRVRVATTRTGATSGNGSYVSVVDYIDGVSVGSSLVLCPIAQSGWRVTSIDPAKGAWSPDGSRLALVPYGTLDTGRYFHESSVDPRVLVITYGDTLDSVSFQLVALGLYDGSDEHTVEQPASTEITEAGETKTTITYNATIRRDRSSGFTVLDVGFSKKNALCAIVLSNVSTSESTDVYYKRLVAFDADTEPYTYTYQTTTTYILDETSGQNLYTRRVVSYRDGVIAVLREEILDLPSVERKETNESGALRKEWNDVTRTWDIIPVTPSANASNEDWNVTGTHTVSLLYAPRFNFESDESYVLSGDDAEAVWGNDMGLFAKYGKRWAVVTTDFLDDVVLIRETDFGDGGRLSIEKVADVIDGDETNWSATVTKTANADSSTSTVFLFRSGGNAGEFMEKTYSSVFPERAAAWSPVTQELLYFHAYGTTGSVVGKLFTGGKWVDVNASADEPTPPDQVIHLQPFYNVSPFGV